MSTNDSWILLTEVADDTEAGLITGYLSNHGISAKSQDNPYSGAMRVIGGLGYEISILVPENQLERARELLRQLPSQESNEESDA